MKNEATVSRVDWVAKGFKERYLDRDFKFLSHDYWNPTTTLVGFLDGGEALGDNFLCSSWIRTIVLLNFFFSSTDLDHVGPVCFFVFSWVMLDPRMSASYLLYLFFILIFLLPKKP